jgi:hypothetical protein
LRHWTQAPSLQIGAASAHPASDVHCTHFPDFAQTGVDVPAQCRSTVHWTQLAAPVLQCGVGDPHCESLVQPRPHFSSSGSQTGAALPQSPFDRHCTHSCARTRQRGALAGQSEFCAHCTHCLVIGSHALSLPTQLADVLHSVHAPLAVSQNGSSPGHDAGPVHAGWHL